jgi:alpha-D-xyloside xylohydrolase
MRRLIVVAAIAAALTGCGGGNPPKGISVRVDSHPFRVTVLDNGKAVVSEDKDARLRYQLASTGNQYTLTNVTSSQGDTYTVATTEPGRTATVTVAATTTGARIQLALHPAAGVQEVYDSFDTGPDDHFLGGGERGIGVDLRGEVLPVKVGYECSYAPIPFFASTAGWGLRIASQATSALAFPGSPGGAGCQASPEPACTFPALADRAETCVQGTTLDERIYVGSLASTLADYEAETGLPAVPPPSELALIKWRDVANGPRDILQDVTRLQAAKVPIGWVLLDNPWEGCNGDLTFNTGTFPDPAAMIRAVHARGVRFMLWVSPLATCYDGYPGSPIGEPPHEVLDLRNPAVVAELQRRIRALTALGIDGVKADRGDENDFETLDPTLTNDYPLLFQRAVMGALPKGDAAIFRSGTVGSQAVVPGMWAGDQPAQYVGLQTAIVSGLSAGMSGFPTWGSDVGGYATPPSPPYEDATLFVRWAQLGAISPVMEVGGTGPNATPWVLGPSAMAGLRAAAVLHYELFPYLYGLLRAHQPVLRPLGFGFPEDPQSWGATYELLVGSDLLAAPVTGPGETPNVYLPPGSWIDLYTGTEVTGRQAFTRPTPLMQFPLYVRSGSVIPFDLRTASGSWWGVDELTHPCRAGYLVTSGAEVNLSGQPHDVQLFVPRAGRPVAVKLDGKPVAWSWNAGPMPGVVVRLHGPTVHGALVTLPS